MVDYSKWKDIEISDDEDETHPNIDTPSLFRWRHQARVERMEEHKKEIQSYEKTKSDHSKKLSDTKSKLKEAEQTGAPNLGDLRQVLAELEKEGKELVKKGDELNKKERKLPWNVDTISQPGFEKTVINKKPAAPPVEHLTEAERESRMKKFIKEHERELKHFGMLKHYNDSKKYLKEHDYLVCEDTANYLVIWCINLEMEGKNSLMEHVAHQTICIQYILELAKSLQYDPRACLDAFFSKIQVAEPMYKASFDEEVSQFKERIRKRAAEKIEEAMKEAEEEEKRNRLGPGGLDPVEVFESLPNDLKQCFESQDIALLQETISKMSEEDARYHMKRCIDSGLWVPEANKVSGDGEQVVEPRSSSAT